MNRLLGIFIILCCLNKLVLSNVIAAINLSNNLSERGFDIIFVIDDSTSMGVSYSPNKINNSDPNGTRYSASNMLITQLYQITQDAAFTHPVDLDIRFSVIAFGTHASIISNWELLSYKHNNTPPEWKTFHPKDRVWTDFDEVFKKVLHQFKQINYGSTQSGAHRELVLILLTDGEPSIKKNKDNLYSDTLFWNKINNYIIELKNININFKFFLIALNNPMVDYWPRVGSEWKKMGAIPIKINTSLIKDSKLFNVLQNKVTNQLYPLTNLSPNTQGKFNVPCFQDRMFFKVFFYENRKYKITLRSPSGRLFYDNQRPGYGGDKNYMQFYVEKPEAGRWSIINYRGRHYNAKYSTVPFDFKYIYPDNKTHIFYPIKRKIELEIAQTKAFKQKEINDCKLQAILKLESFDLSVKSELKVNISRNPLDPNKLKLETKPFLPKLNNSYLTFQLKSHNVSAFKVVQQAFQLSHKKPIQVDMKSQTVADLIENDVITIQIRMVFRNNKGDKMSIEDIFGKPNKSFSVRIQCKLKPCPFDENKYKMILLQKMDNFILGADIKIKLYKTSLYSRVIRIIKNVITHNPIHFKISFNNTGQINLHEDYILVPLREK